VVATAGIGTIGLSWNPVPGATNYYVYTSLISHPAAYDLYTVTNGTSFPQTSLYGGASTVYFVVRGVNDAGVGPSSAEVSGTPTLCNALTCGGCCSGNTCLAGNDPAHGCVAGGGQCGAACGSHRVCSGGACVFDCSSCLCGCTGTACRAPKPCNARKCTDGGGVCDVCGGCVFE
jgi:hypothetical protein